MFNQAKKWWKKQEAIVRKTGGLAEKEASIQRKLDVAMSILNRRKEDVPVSFERRKENRLRLA